MNQQCKVCGEPAAGFHFGAFTCEGCKSFFGRTYNNLGSISECKNNGECVINKKNRTACKACRLRKCLLVGMSKSGSRYGRRSNWFKIHCLLQEQQQQAAGGMAGMAGMAGLLRPHPYLPLFRAAPPGPTDAKSSESDSGASSADPDDDLRSASALRNDFYHHHTTSAMGHKLPSPVSDGECFARRKLSASITLALPASPASLPSVSPTGTRWLPPPPLGLADPAAWRDLWIRAPPAPGQDQPIDLSIRASAATTPPPSASSDASEPELSIDVGVEEACKPVPLDLTLETKRVPDLPLTG